MIVKYIFDYITYAPGDRGHRRTFTDKEKASDFLMKLIVYMDTADYYVNGIDDKGEYHFDIQDTL